MSGEKSYLEAIKILNKLQKNYKNLESMLLTAKVGETPTLAVKSIQIKNHPWRKQFLKDLNK